MHFTSLNCFDTFYHKYEVMIGKHLVVILILPRTSGLIYWLIKPELLVIQAQVLGYLGLGYWLLNQELRPDNSWFRSWFRFRCMVSQFSIFLGWFRFLLSRNTGLLASW